MLILPLFQMLCFKCHILFHWVFKEEFLIIFFFKLIGHYYEVLLKKIQQLIITSFLPCFNSEQLWQLCNNKSLFRVDFWRSIFFTQSALNSLCLMTEILTVLCSHICLQRYTLKVRAFGASATAQFKSLKHSCDK